ncbi:SDR family NAD(P)-dependent oxidoreductase [Dendronalium sp. ChiSLP03b]|uniref:SDR family NAD(P)-dependent oxidoreductase n=1 Tax=Dendronalium sp. ChiSLP03b TaxID=3075381 RepID=UPI002AD458A2|nr:SDR family NAD(P)-dependent oxidoreductase [Dendronalium sp. ChiSLP03b]MDZ8207779.1 hypothetical protein [Dendronalium sp. ChiSLP03b]
MTVNIFVQLLITDPQQVNTLIEKAIAKFGQIDILVNVADAGILKPYNSVEPST